MAMIFQLMKQQHLSSHPYQKGESASQRFHYSPVIAAGFSANRQMMAMPNVSALG